MDDLSELDNSCIVEVTGRRARQGRSPREHSRQSATYIEEDCRTPLLQFPLRCSRQNSRIPPGYSAVRRRPHQAQAVREVQSLSQLAFEDVNVAKISTLHYSKLKIQTLTAMSESFIDQGVQLFFSLMRIVVVVPEFVVQKTEFLSLPSPNKKKAAKSLFFGMTTGHHIVRPCLLMM